MDGTSRQEARRAVGIRRIPPGLRGRWVVGSDGKVEAVSCRDGLPPAEIWFETGNVEALPSDWREPEWLASRARQWSHETVLLGMSAVDGQAPCSAMSECFAKVRRIATSWHIVLRTDGQRMTSMPAIHQVLAGPFDEIQFLSGRSRHSDGMFGERVLMVIKQLLELRAARKQDRPAVAWLHEVSAERELGGQQLQNIESTARQLAVDRFEVIMRSGQA